MKFKFPLEPKVYKDKHNRPTGTVKLAFIEIEAASEEEAIAKFNEQFPQYDFNANVARRKASAELNTICPKLGANQWTCSKDECICHLKETINDR